MIQIKTDLIKEVFKFHTENDLNHPSEPEALIGEDDTQISSLSVKT